MERRMSTLTLLLLVTVLSGVGAVVVTIPQAVYEVARGKSVTLPCNIKPQGTPKQIIVTWSTVALTPDAQEDDVLTYYSNDRTTDFGSLYEGRASLDVDATTTNANLVLSSTTLDDNKKFQCQALIQGDLKGTPTAYTRLVVLVAPSTPTCMTQGKAEYGQNINLTCVSQEGSPPPVYTWKSQDVKNNPRAFPPRTTDQGGILSLFNISKETSGFFICTSTNKIGSASCNLTLAVMPPSMNIASTAGIIGGVIAALIVLIIVIYCCCCRKKKKDEEYDMGVREEEEERETVKEPVRNGLLEDTRGSDSSARNPVELSERDYKNSKELDDRRSDYDDRRRDDDRRSDYDDRRRDDDRRSDYDDRRSDYTDRRERYSDRNERYDDDRRYDDRRDRRSNDDDRYDDRNRDRPAVPANKPPRRDFHD
ncbi:glycoprotein A33 (transmembrane), paralog a isoform X1 [Etheostoma spectabile]|uniref:glycoprotein A33 (transmembrane), paralog a isoform X1 n=1 Tax=Etheostoma spectabile TaxID=54343 RepID=UPI0013AE9820|nr:cell surface A33 antigen-like isoform X1 [Etheostoma spectabile]